MFRNPKQQQPLPYWSPRCCSPGCCCCRRWHDSRWSCCRGFLELNEGTPADLQRWKGVSKMRGALISRDRNIVTCFHDQETFWWHTGISLLLVQLQQMQLPHFCSPQSWKNTRHVYFIRRGRVDHQLKTTFCTLCISLRVMTSSSTGHISCRLSWRREPTGTVSLRLPGDLTEQRNESEIYREPIRTLMVSSLCREQFLHNNKFSFISLVFSRLRSVSTMLCFIRLLPVYLDFSTLSAVTQ